MWRRGAGDTIGNGVFGLTFGELFIVVFLTVSVVSAPWWPRVGEWIADLFVGGRAARPSVPPERRDRTST
jgi:hypothetical protein